MSKKKQNPKKEVEAEEVAPYRERVEEFEKELTKLQEKYHLQLRVNERTLHEIKAVDTLNPQQD